MKFKKEDGKLYLVDTTLRDGEQTAGVVFANSEKIRIAKMLDEIGVNQLEVGIPTMGGDEKETIAKIAKLGLNASIMAWNRAVIDDVKESLECGVDAVAISISTSDIHIEHKLRTSRQWVLDHMTSAVQFAKKEGVYVSVNAEDASRTDIDFLIEFAKCAKEAGADRLRFCDTVGILDPFKTFDVIKRIKESIDIDIEMHTHNDFGMATANALAGFKAGANFIGVTVNGLGERAGNAALEEVVMALKHVYKYDIGIDTKRFRELSEYVSAASGRQLPSWKAIVGTNVFAHESGIHVDGALKDPHTYEIFDPDEVGLERQIVIGKHSGTAALINKFKEYGRTLPENEAKELLPYVRSLSIQLKRPLFDKELIYLYEEHISKIKAI
ncbi:homocitrate synthase [Thermoanaerobacterium thermosaccharolyticum]|jgi:homocitrate synthase NifV|uniref:Homocitrate synthase n=3 Tax=Thermoanaerobacterium thermosaccharolyticum TaxID=1517 RepID=D9TS27_THETC|nr:homocitrate synthase [Thermoanaerobacterium thermosaccharolyticum]ADL69706.1 homocitrate synthase [Thermoanaerobacterium thermosaccharolyticum DSM 571]AGB19878.1 homocitrate synthase NifV [Thermoanaerobacterium thermosaccharolyticum M0795]AST56899.1 homocitrate synthase [Thermoanaerobacterium thermosaccharolyticum]KAA5806290.1 homocitrate synthase [Thermoanaerobacterium thermosaccharolyticum]MCP2239767.1 homocitrate synthase NifV [Thermoanaerobacterium thermosaccharolyticum]